MHPHPSRGRLHPTRLTRGDVALALAVACFAALAQVLLMSGTVQVYDEGLRLYGAAEVLRGNVPYRDYWTLYGPAMDYVLGAVFAAFGPSVLAARAVDVAWRVLAVVLCYVIGRRLGSRAFALATALVGLAVLVASATYETPVFATIGTALLAVVCAWRSLVGPTPVRDALVAGLATAVTGALRTDMGAYATCAVLVGFALHARYGRGRPGWWRRSVAPFAAAAAAGVTVVAALLLATVPLAHLFDDFVRIPFTVYAANRRLPFPLEPALALRRIGPLRNYLVYLPFVVVVASAASWWASRRGGLPPSTDAATHPATSTLHAMIVTLATLFILKGVVRVELAHMAPAIVVSMVACVPLFERWVPRRAPVPMLVLLLLAATKIALPPDDFGRPLRRLAAAAALVAHGTVPPACGAPPIERMRCFDVDADTLDVLRRVIAESPADAPIYVATGRHDKLFVNNVEFYFLADRRAPTRWHDLHPGVQTTAPIQRDMIRDFERRPPSLVVVNTTWDDYQEPNASRTSSGVTLLDDWIGAHYQRVYARGPWSVLARVEAPVQAPLEAPVAAE